MQKVWELLQARMQAQERVMHQCSGIETGILITLECLPRARLRKICGKHMASNA